MIINSNQAIRLVRLEEDLENLQSINFASEEV